MDASIRGAGLYTGTGRAEEATGKDRGPASYRLPLRDPGVPASLAGLRVALVHDWLTGMRGGEKCLEVLCRAFPDATLHTLIHRRGALSPAIESMKIRTSLLQKIPGVLRFYRHLLPIMPLAARGWKVGDVDVVISLSHCVAKAVVAPPGIAHICYCFTPMRYAWQGRDAYLESWSNRPVRRLIARKLLSRLRRWDRASASRVSHFVAISETVRERIARCYRRDSRVIQPPVDVEYYTPADDSGRRSDAYLVVSALVPYKRIDHAVSACSRTGRRLIVIGEGPERARLEGMAGSSVQFLGWQPDEIIREHYRQCRALLFPGDEDFGIVPIEALACGMPVIALGRGGVAETVDNAVGRTYADPSSGSLATAIEEWESSGCRFDAALCRRRAEALSLDVFRARILGLIGDVVSARRKGDVPPAPHFGLVSASS
jgi:glycosyltransferase involved in cell wall biosynthesis